MCDYVFINLSPVFSNMNLIVVKLHPYISLLLVHFNYVWSAPTLYCNATVLVVQGFFQLLALSVLPCFLLKAAREVIHVVCMHSSWWQSVGVAVALLVSWTYSTVIYLSGTALFHFVCNLQVIHFENYGNLLERDLDVSVGTHAFKIQSL